MKLGLHLLADVRTTIGLHPVPFLAWSSNDYCHSFVFSMVLHSLSGCYVVLRGRLDRGTCTLMREPCGCSGRLYSKNINFAITKILRRSFGYDAALRL